MNSRLDHTFFDREALVMAPEILGKTLVRVLPDGSRISLPITEVEVYRGTDDLACHASKGLTERNRVMFGEGGIIYMYFIYGMHWMFNIIAAGPGQPEALLIRGVGEISGPGRVTKILAMDRSFYGEDLRTSKRIWLEDAPAVTSFQTGPRVGINYAGEPWVSVPWRYRVDVW
ncbi:MAG: DNA-3-methyladenine glycosylase [Bacteroidales bacterium]